MGNPRVIGAFGEDDAARLTGLSVSQLRSWDRSAFFTPSYAPENRRQPFSRVYSFRDIVALRVLHSLRHQHGVSLQHLRMVSKRLVHLGEEKWTAQTLYVLGRRVVFDDPRSLERREILSGQRVFDIPLKVAISDTHRAIRSLNVRQKAELGHVVQHRFTMNNRPVFEGTRIPVKAVIRYLERGCEASEILKEFPELTSKDILKAQQQAGADAA